VQDVENRRFAMLTRVVECLQYILLRKVVLHALEGFRGRVRHGIRRFHGHFFRILIPLLIVERGAPTNRDDQAAYDREAVRALHYSSPPLRRNLSYG
jgi:hypothetical protein